MKINLLAIFLLLSVCSTAQIQKGAMMIGGDLSVNFSKFQTADINQNAYKSQSFNFSPNIGWVVKDNMIVGGRLIASYYSSEEVPMIYYKTKGNSLGAGVWLRKYLPLGKSIYFFANTDLNGSSNYRKQTNDQEPAYFFKETGFTVNAAIYPGISYQLKNNFFLDAALNNLFTISYTRIKSEQNKQDGTNYRGMNNNFGVYSSLGSGVPLQLGIRWLLNGKQS